MQFLKNNTDIVEVKRLLGALQKRNQLGFIKTLFQYILLMLSINGKDHNSGISCLV